MQNIGGDMEKSQLSDQQTVEILEEIRVKLAESTSMDSYNRLAPALLHAIHKLGKKKRLKK